jgi:hypothetical protein
MGGEAALTSAGHLWKFTGSGYNPSYRLLKILQCQLNIELIALVPLLQQSTAMCMGTEGGMKRSKRLICDISKNCFYHFRC